MIIKKLLVCAILSGFAYVSNAQVSHGGTPYAWTEKSNLDGVQFVEMPSVNIEALRAEDQVTEQYKDIPLRFAHAHEVNFNLLNAGTWTPMPDGGKIWRLGVESPGAYSLNFTFDQFELVEGAQLFIYNAEKSYLIGSFTKENNKPSGQLGTAPVQGDKVIVELYEPKSKHQSKLSISHIAHDYKDAFKLAKGFGTSGSCNNNVNCPISNGWEDQISSVALITLGNGTRWCSGAMVANTSGDDTPYFLTADHCEDGQTVTNWVFYFNYESAACSPNTDGSLTQSVSGSTLRAENPNSDVCLLELSSAPPVGYGVFYSGWDNSGAAVPNAVGIHHPDGDVKKFSVENDALSPSGNYWRVNDWDDGTTEPGSSGSPLFDQNKRIIGQLFGGFAACGNDEWDEYGKLDVSWNGASASARLKDWLDPTSSGSTTLDGYYPGSASLGEKQSNLEFKVYPNPSTGTFIVDLNAVFGTEATVKVYSSQGEVLLTIPAVNSSVSIDLGDRANGVYFVQVSNETTISTQRINLIR